jgi:hypothetical protein
MTKAEYYATRLIDELRESPDQNDVAFAGLVLVSLRRWQAGRARALLKRMRELPTNWQQLQLTQWEPGVN